MHPTIKPRPAYSLAPSLPRSLAPSLPRSCPTSPAQTPPQLGKFLTRLQPCDLFDQFEQQLTFEGPRRAGRRWIMGGEMVSRPPEQPGHRTTVAALQVVAGRGDLNQAFPAITVRLRVGFPRFFPCFVGMPECPNIKTGETRGQEILSHRCRGPGLSNPRRSMAPTPRRPRPPGRSEQRDYPTRPRVCR